MLIRGALANALAFTGSSYLFHRLSKDSIDAERKRHDAALINNQLRLERKAETKVTELK